MRMALHITLLLVALVLITGCSRTKDDIGKDFLDKFEEFVDLVEDCDSPADVKAKKSELKAIGRRLEELNEELEGLELSTEEEEKMEKEYKRKLERLGSGLEPKMRQFAHDEEALRIIQGVLIRMR